MSGQEPSRTFPGVLSPRGASPPALPGMCPTASPAQTPGSSLVWGGTDSPHPVTVQEHISLWQRDP